MAHARGECERVASVNLMMCFHPIAVAAVPEPLRKPGITLEDGLRNLEIAVAATRGALGEE